MRNGLGRVIALIVVATLLLTLVPTSPADAAPGVDILYAAPTGWSSGVAGTGCGSATVPPAGACDANDATGVRADGNDGDGNSSGEAGYWYSYLAAWTRTSGVSSFVVSSMRLLVKTCASGDNACTGATLDMDRVIVKLWTGSCVGAALADESYAATSSLDTGYFDITPTSMSSGYGLCINVHTAAQNTSQWFMAFSTEAYAESTVAPADFTDYIAGLHIEHPSFRRTIGWQWIKTWDGTWSVTDSDDDVLAGGLSGATAGTFGFVSIQCIPLCGADTYTITVHEDGFETVTYEIDGDDSGYLIAPAGAAIFVYVNGCYNASTDQCHDAAIPVGGSTHWDTAASGAANVRFKYECNNASQLDPTCEGGTVWIGKAETDDFGCGTQNPLFGPITGTSPNTLYEQVMTGWGTVGSMRGIVVWRSGTDPDVHACRVFGPMATAGGIEIPRETPQAQLPECDIYSLPCQIGIAIRDALDGGRELWESAVDEAVGDLHDAAASKLPFAYVVLAFDGISEQIARANASVENSDDCEGVTLNVPLPYGGSNLSASPSPFPINVLRCDQLEPVMGTSWYQAIRTALDPALWLLFAWSQFKALQPKTSLNG